MVRAARGVCRTAAATEQRFVGCVERTTTSSRRCVARTLQYYADGLAWQRRFRREVASLLEGVDALIMPATDTTAPARLDTTGTPKFQAPWSCAGLPVISIPCGLASDAMPVALQLVAPVDGEANLFRVARWCEQRLAFAELPPLAI